MAKKSLTITLIGAGSRVFGFNMGADICQTPALKGAHVRLVDVDGAKVEEMKQVFQQMSDDRSMDLQISTYTSHKKALPGTDYVIISVAMNRINNWETDLALSRKHGIVETQGECGGPGGLSLTLRNIPLVLSIARDIERICPKALVLNFSNPMTRVCRAISKYTSLKVVGLCHGLLGVQNLFSRLLKKDVIVSGIGINHFNWVYDARFAGSKKNAWPAIEKVIANTGSASIPEWLYSRELFGVFDRFVSPDDGHIADFIHHWRGSANGLNPQYRLKPKAMGWYREDASQWEARIQGYLQGKKRPMDDVKGLSGEGAIPIIATTAGLAKPYTEIAVNVPNKGYIENLPADALVEVPGLISRGKVAGVRSGKLPAALRAVIALQLEIADLAVEAAVEKSYKKALQALAIDPLVTDLKFARNYLDDVLTAYKGVIGKFK